MIKLLIKNWDFLKKIQILHPVVTFANSLISCFGTTWLAISCLDVKWNKIDTHSATGFGCLDFLNFYDFSGWYFDAFYGPHMIPLIRFDHLNTLYTWHIHTKSLALWSKFNTPPVDLIQNPIQRDNLISQFLRLLTTKSQMQKVRILSRSWSVRLLYFSNYRRHQVSLISPFEKRLNWT